MAPTKKVGNPNMNLTKGQYAQLGIFSHFAIILY